MSSSSKKKLRKEQAAADLTGKQTAQQKEDRKVRRMTVAFIVVIALAICSAAATLGIRAYRNSGVHERSITALTVGSHKLNSTELNYFYVDAINNFYQSLYSSYGSSASSAAQLMYGLDFTKPLDEQTYSSSSEAVSDIKTWGDYCVQLAENTAKATYAFYDYAVTNTFTLSYDAKATVTTQMNTLTSTAKTSGFSSLKKYLKAMYGNGATTDSYESYLTASVLATSYAADHSANLDITDADLREYEADKYDEYSSYSYATYYVAKSNYITGGTTDDDGNTTYTDEEQQAAIDAAKADADKLVAAATSLDEFNKAIAALDVNKEKDSAKATEYTDQAYSYVNTTAKEWITDSSRKAGDVTCIENTTESTDDDGNTKTSVNGYYVVLFQNCNENKFPLANVRHILVKFEGGTTDSNGSTTYSDEEKAAAKEKAESLLQQWKDGDATEESFAALAKETSEDSGSVANGGLYEDVYPGQMVTNFNDWCFAEGRKAGDTGIVESDYGYHVMYYVGDSDITYRDYRITADVRTKWMQEWQDGLTNSVSFEIGDISGLNTSLVLSRASTT